MKLNPFYIIWGVVSLLLIGGASFFLLSSKSGYDEVKDSYDDKEVTIERLQNKIPFPDAESVEEMEKLAAEYQTSVDELFTSLKGFERPLNMSLRDEDFPVQLRDKLDAFTAAAKDKGMLVKAGKDGKPFYFGMDRYRETLPASKNVPLLDYQLEAIDGLLTIMLESGIDTLVSLTREPLAMETAPGEPDPTLGQPVVRYEIRLQFVADHEALQTFINKIANDKKFFYLLRVIRVDNSAPNGPRGGDDGANLGGGIEWANSEGDKPPDSILTQVDALDDVEEQIAYMAERGFSPVQADAKIILGDEKVEVFAVIDVARFPTPDERGDGAADGNGATDAGK